MEFLVLDREFRSIKMLDTFESMIWTDRYQQAGDFELYLSMDNALLDYLKEDYYLWTEGSDHQMIIETHNILSDVEEGNKLIVTGRSLESILTRRIIWGQVIISGNLQNGVKQLITDAFINPTIPERKINNFVFKDSTDEYITSLSIDAQYTGDDLYDVICDICKDADIGFKIVLTPENTFEFSLYRGEDRSYSQTKNPYVIFSPSYENIINSNYLSSKSAMKNVTLVAGEGEGADRKTTIVGSGAGLDRRELFTDARDISSNLGDGTTLSQDEYMKQLSQRGSEKLAEHSTTVSFDGEVEATQLFVYGEDFYIGDTVQIANEYGHEGTAFISEFIMSQSESGISMYPTFETIQEDD